MRKGKREKYRIQKKHMKKERQDSDTGESIEKRTTEFEKTSNTGESIDKKEDKMQRIIERAKKWHNENQMIWTANAEKRKRGHREDNYWKKR